jgi:hypothetical protein
LRLASIAIEELRLEAHKPGNKSSWLSGTSTEELEEVEPVLEWVMFAGSVSGELVQDECEPSSLRLYLESARSGRLLTSRDSPGRVVVVVVVVLVRLPKP